MLEGDIALIQTVYCLFKQKSPTIPHLGICGVSRPMPLDSFSLLHVARNFSSKMLCNMLEDFIIYGRSHSKASKSG